MAAASRTRPHFWRTKQGGSSCLRGASGRQDVHHSRVDFLIERGGAVCPLEVKSGAGYRHHAALDAVLSVADYGLKDAMVLCGEGEVEKDFPSYVPIYATMFLEHDPLPEKLIYEV